MIDCYTTLLTSTSHKESALSSIHAKVESLINDLFSDLNSTTLTLSALFVSIFSSISNLSSLPDFPDHRVSNYWRSYHIDTSPFSSAVEVVNTATSVSGLSSGVLFFADLFTSYQIPALPASGCGLQDKDTTDP